MVSYTLAGGVAYVVEEEAHSLYDTA
jgi:hypothetical protein